MDAELKPNEPKREDLRLTLPNRPGWEGIVEVKGYTDGVKTNDARQIREHRERYIARGRSPHAGPDCVALQPVSHVGAFFLGRP